MKETDRIYKFSIKLTLLLCNSENKINETN